MGEPGIQAHVVGSFLGNARLFPEQNPRLLLHQTLWLAAASAQKSAADSGRTNRRGRTVAIPLFPRSFLAKFAAARTARHAPAARAKAMTSGRPAEIVRTYG
jgi:hypothetical protein